MKYKELTEVEQKLVIENNYDPVKSQEIILPKNIYI